MNKFLFYYSNLHIGAGLLGGSYAGLERDEQGNINGFNPQNFALGFASGAGLSKGLQLSTKRLEKLASKHPKAKALLDRIQGKHALSPNATKAQNLATISQSKEITKGQNMLDFQISTPQESKSAHLLRYELKQILKPITAKPIINKNDGRVAIISSKSIGKFNSAKAADESIKNGFSEAQHFEVAKHIKSLYEKAIFKESSPDKYGNSEVKIHRYTSGITLDGKPAQAKITLKETTGGIYKGNRIYTIELESIAKLSTEPQTLAKKI